MLVIACVKHGKKYTADYVNILYDMVTRNLDQGTVGRFVCFTDNVEGLDKRIEVCSMPENFTGWWCKLYLFRSGLFKDEDRILYFDLDTVITGALDEIVKYKGDFAILRDFYRANGLQNSVMAWRANTMHHIYESYIKAGFPDIPGGDQAWIERCFAGKKCDIWQDLYKGDFYSYKVHATEGIPNGSKVIIFHGEPRPHECNNWVSKIWKIGGGSNLELMQIANIDPEQAIKNLTYALSLDLPVVYWVEPHEDHAVIVGGGPSLESQIEEIRWRQSIGQKIFATNNTRKYLADRGIYADYQVILDGRAENADFVYKGVQGGTLLLASQCHADVFEKAKFSRIVLWHSKAENIESYLDKKKNYALIGSGSTVGLKALALAYTLGYREMHLYGLDSSYDMTRHHAYDQSLNDNEKVLEVEVHDRKFECTGWMATQVREFQEIVPQLISAGCVLTVHGDGMLQHAMKYMQHSITAADIRAQEILTRLQGVNNPLVAEIGVFAGDLSKRLLLRNDLTLFMIDSWTTTEADDAYAKSGDFHANLTQQQQDDYCEHTKNVTMFAKDRAIIIRMKSIDAAKALLDNMLDLVFIDADHSYEGCKADIEAWHKKVKKGGWLSGHDYKNFDFPCFGVEQAVDEFVKEHGLELELGDNFTWFIKINN